MESVKHKSLSKMNKKELYEHCKIQHDEIITLQLHLNCLEMETNNSFESFVKKINIAHEINNRDLKKIKDILSPSLSIHTIYTKIIFKY